MPLKKVWDLDPGLRRDDEILKSINFVFNRTPMVLNMLLNNVYDLDSGPPEDGSAVADFRWNDGF